MVIENGILDQLLKDVDPKNAFSSEGLLAEIEKALAELMLNGELDHRLESEAAAPAANDEPTGNFRNGYSRKTVITDRSQVELEIPRYRRGTFEPQLIARYQLRFPGFDGHRCLAIGVTPDGRKDVLGIWIEQNERARDPPELATDGVATAWFAFDQSAS